MQPSSTLQRDLVNEIQDEAAIRLPTAGRPPVQTKDKTAAHAIADLRLPQRDHVRIELTTWARKVSVLQGEYRPPVNFSTKSINSWSLTI